MLHLSVALKVKLNIIQPAIIKLYLFSFHPKGLLFKYLKHGSVVSR